MFEYAACVKTVHVGFKPCYTLGVYFGHSHIMSFGKKPFGQHSHSGPHLDHRQFGTVVKCCRYTFGNSFIFQKMLAEGFLRSYGIHCH